MVYGLGFTSSRSLVTGILQSSGLVGLLCGGGRSTSAGMLPVYSWVSLSLG